MAWWMERRGYQDLIAWQKAVDLAALVYSLTAQWPRDERFGLTDQLQRAAVSVPANIAEGQGRSGNREFARFLSIAHGSLCEVETYFVLARRLGLIDAPAQEAVMSQAAEVGRLIQGLLRRFNRPNSV